MRIHLPSNHNQCKLCWCNLNIVVIFCAERVEIEFTGMAVITYAISVLTLLCLLHCVMLACLPNGDGLSSWCNGVLMYWLSQ